MRIYYRQSWPYQCLHSINNFCCTTSWCQIWSNETSACGTSRGKLNFGRANAYHSITVPRKKTSLGESLAGSHAYNPIRNSRRDSWRDFLTRKVLPTVWPRVLPRVLLRVLPRLSVRLLARLLARFFAPKSLAKSLGESLVSDYMQDSRRDSLRDSFFLRGELQQFVMQHSSCNRIEQAPRDTKKQLGIIGMMTRSDTQ